MKKNHALCLFLILAAGVVIGGTPQGTDSKDPIAVIVNLRNGLPNVPGMQQRTPSNSLIGMP